MTKHLSFSGLLSSLTALLLLLPSTCYAKTVLRGPEDNNISNEALLESVNKLLERVSSLEQHVSSLENERNELRERLDALEQARTESSQQHERRLQDSCIVQDTRAGGSLIMEGCNIEIRSGSGATSTLNGLGNLILGYNEPDSNNHVRTGSHNLVVGVAHGYSSHSGIVSGRSNDINQPAAAAVGGHNNAVDGPGGVALGGNGNVVRGQTAVAVGGNYNVAASTDSSTFGGGSNTAQAQGSTVVGGKGGMSTGLYSVSVGGF